jgi:hypothetical protein
VSREAEYDALFCDEHQMKHCPAQHDDSCAMLWLDDAEIDHLCTLSPEGHPGECVCECGARWCEGLTLVTP